MSVEALYKELRPGCLAHSRPAAKRPSHQDVGPGPGVSVVEWGPPQRVAGGKCPLPGSSSTGPLVGKGAKGQGRGGSKPLGAAGRWAAAFSVSSGCSAPRSALNWVGTKLTQENLPRVTGQWSWGSNTSKALFSPPRPEATFSAWGVCVCVCPHMCLAINE